MKLYEVTKRYYVVAENTLEAEFIRIDGDIDTDVEEATSVDSKWWDSIPFGRSDDKTCGQLLHELNLAQPEPSNLVAHGASTEHETDTA